MIPNGLMKIKTDKTTNWQNAVKPFGSIGANHKSTTSASTINRFQQCIFVFFFLKCLYLANFGDQINFHVASVLDMHKFLALTLAEVISTITNDVLTKMRKHL